MNDGISTEDQIKKQYLYLRKYTEYLKKDHSKLMSNNFGINEWRKEGRKIELNMNNYFSTSQKLENILIKAKDDENVSKELITKIESTLNSIKKDYQSKFEEMKIKIDKFKIMNIDDECEEQNEDEDIIGPIELNNNLIEEYIRKRKKELEDLQKTAQMIENTKEQMRRYVERQEERLEDIEEPEKKEDKKERKT